MQVTWTRYVLLCLGLWLICQSLLFSQSAHDIVTSNVLSGVLVIFLSLRAGTNWWLCLVGVWLVLSPIIFWAKSPADFLNDTLIGALIIALSVVVQDNTAEKGPEVPSGWSYNPSSWVARLPIAFLAFFCFLCSRYMASFQLGYIDTIWDPLFHDGTYFVITSDISKAFPVSDAGLGSCAYLIETLMALKGGTKRWHTMPWMVALFGFLVVPVGLVSVLLIMLQPVVVGHWCFWCLLTALFMLLMVMLTLDEVCATLQFLYQAVKVEKKPFWTVFWHGSLQEERKDARTPALDSSFKKIFEAMLWGTTVPWTLVISFLIGLFLMFCPAYFALPIINATIDHIMGALIAATSVIAMCEACRAVRWLNVIFGLAVAVGSFFVTDGHVHYWDNFVLGGLLIVMSFFRGKIKESYGSLNGYIR